MSALPKPWMLNSNATREISNQIRQTSELKRALTNVKTTKFDTLRQKRTLEKIRGKNTKIRKLSKGFFKFIKKGGYVGDAFEKGQWNKSAGNAALGARVVSIINIGSLVASFAGLGLSIGNTWLGEVRNEVNENRFDLYGKELGNQLKLIADQKKRITQLERASQRNTADLDILSGAVGQQAIKVNRVETGQTFLSGQFAMLQSGFSTSVQAFNNALQGTRNELINRIEAIKRDGQNPSSQFNANEALIKARQALNTALSTAKKQTDQEQRIKQLERQRTSGIQNQLRIATERANQALKTANGIKDNFQKSIDQTAKKIRDELEREQQLRAEREKFISQLLDRKQDKSQILDLISNNIGRFYELYLKPQIIQEIRPVDIKANVAIDAISRQQQDINNIRGQVLQALTLARIPGPRGLPGLQGPQGLPGKDGKVDNKIAEEILRRLGRQDNQLQKIDNAVQAGNNQNAQGFTKVQERFNKLAERLKLPEIINALTLIVVLHNAAMLSRDLISTLLQVISNGMAVIGLKDENGQPYDISQIIGREIGDWAKQILGEQVFNNLVFTWQKANRVYQASANMYSSVRSMFDSARQVGEWTAENVGKIGNALRKNGVVSDDAYPPMAENVSGVAGTNAKFQRMVDRLEGLNDAANSLSSVTGDVLSITQEVNEFRQHQADFKKALEEQPPKPAKPNKPIQKAETDSDKISTPKIISESDKQIA